MNIVTYLKETRAEIKHVSWPTRSQAIMLTIAVVIISLAIAAYLGFFDWIFIKVVNTFV